MSEDEQGMGEESFQEKLSGQLGGFAEAVQKFGVGKLIFFIVFLLVGGYLVSYYASLSSFAVSVEEIDSEKRLDSATVSLEFQGLFGPETKDYPFDDGEGGYRFSGVPKNRQVKVSVSLSGFRQFEETIIPQDSGGSFTAKLYRVSSVGLQAKESLAAVSMGPSCQRVFTVVASAGESDAEGVSLVADGFPEESKFSFIGSAVDIPANESAELKFMLTTSGAPEGPASGRVRVKGTSSSLGVSLIVGEAPVMRVDPSEIRQTQTREPVEIVISNGGETDLSNINVTQFNNKVSIRDAPPNVQSLLTVLPPRASVRLWVDPVADAGQGYVVVSADCVPPQQVSVNLG